MNVMSAPDCTCPAPRSKLIELYFLEHRAKLLDIAAFLDRLDRAEGADDDFRILAFRRALAVLLERPPGRTRRILDLFSDPTTEPIEAATGKSACGAYPHAVSIES